MTPNRSHSSDCELHSRSMKGPSWTCAVLLSLPAGQTCCRLKSVTTRQAKGIADSLNDEATAFLNGWVCESGPNVRLTLSFYGFLSQDLIPWNKKKQ